MIIPLSIQLDLKIHQPDQIQNQTQDHIISLNLNEKINENSIQSTLITLPKLETSSNSSSTEFDWNLSFSSIENELDSITSMKDIPIRSQYIWLSLDEYFILWLSARNWLTESSQTIFNPHPTSTSTSYPTPNEDFNFDFQNQKQDFNLNPNDQSDPNPNPNQTYESNDESSIKLKETLTALNDNDADEFIFFKSLQTSNLHQTPKDNSQETLHSDSDDLNIFNELDDPLPTSSPYIPITNPDPSHELDFLL
ncbi:uncharacterized protein MELLADRAFT_58515 [Melampsora larici-populina 98AG31]|uniref:Uncharacterized protein n=1 Tax=Melampsora larici-populina (strain 98AG31 / pathotype 3-4-7) TaxID=747676 RepID=F4R3S9_MELLP|nr:uncharacterized protein MELLADRAFT_58515 [Melampsora larici-populina 98AG31]EGG12681.1 hypothetical protein MELLADRAFT_58515 [Melampsora larici-populina 98AG31]